MKYIVAACTIALGLILGGCADNQPADQYQTPPAHHNMGGKLGGKLGNQ
ncbi:MAG: hypothetical protein P1U40_03700 [Coxiellaceae bacterium]|nr:hypothetical protein [Coxiellaceae bacterium]MDF1759623.1 hypothetical protein [Coxiellaceae bacterium]